MRYHIDDFELSKHLYGFIVSINETMAKDEVPWELFSNQTLRSFLE